MVDQDAAVDVDLTAWSCPMPLRDHPRIVTGHGGGGRLSQELIDHLFRPDRDGSEGQVADEPDSHELQEASDAQD
jgi:hypothetical protein